MGTVKKQKRARKEALKNRYCAGAKLSEHKFLRILRGFAEGVTLSALEPMTHTSGKTIRTTYRALRERLAEAIHKQPLMFGGAGSYLAHPDATPLLAAIRSSAVFRRYRKQHAPRMKVEAEEQRLVLEFAVRLFCALDLRNVSLGLEDLLVLLAQGVRALKSRDPLQKLAEVLPGARPHGHPGARVYEDLRRHLLRSPLGMAAGKSVSSLQATDSPVTIPAITRLPFMPIRHAIWTVGQTPQELRLSRLPSEQVLEEMITATPSILSEEWMLIGRQERTSYDGRIDLIAIAPDGSLILIEIKRDRTPREVAAQALDYASWIEQLEPEDIGRIYERFSKGRNLKEDFEKRFGHSIPDEELNQSHQIIIVAAELDQSTERIVRYLNDRDIPINVLFFQVFEHGSQQLLSRAWIIDPVETQVHAAETATPSKDKEPWNGEYYANFGHSSTRPWDEARQYGFISGGGGKFYSGTLKLLREGDRVWVRVPGEGFVGVGIVKGPMQHALDFQVETPDGPRPAMDVLTGGTYHREYLNDPERSEYFVPIEWIKTVPLSQAVNEAGMFGNQNTVCRPKTRQWSYTIDLLKRAFDIT